jgi:hypothetical protein
MDALAGGRAQPPRLAECSAAALAPMTRIARDSPAFQDRHE